MEAATTQYVNAKGDIYLRDAANRSAKKITTIKNHTALTVLSSSNGWSYVQVGKEKGYVYTSALSKKNPQEHQKLTGGFSPKEGLTLTYSPAFDSDKSSTYDVLQDPDKPHVKKLINREYPDSYSYAVYVETDESLFLGFTETDWVVAYASYPLQKGRYFSTYQEGYKLNYFVESTTATHKVKAGTFNNVTVVRSGDWRYYYVKNIGVIRITFDGISFVELASIK